VSHGALDEPEHGVRRVRRARRAQSTQRARRVTGPQGDRRVHDHDLRPPRCEHLHTARHAVRSETLVVEGEGSQQIEPGLEAQRLLRDEQTQTPRSLREAGAQQQ
jgi:hypothetical protein